MLMELKRDFSGNLTLHIDGKSVPAQCAVEVNQQPGSLTTVQVTLFADPRFEGGVIIRGDEV